MKTGLTKLDEDTSIEKAYRLRSLMNIVPNAHKKMLTNRIQQHIKKTYKCKLSSCQGVKDF
jgi:hypothetical protein